MILVISDDGSLDKQDLFIFSFKTEKRTLMLNLYKFNEFSFPKSLVNIYFAL